MIPAAWLADHAEIGNSAGQVPVPNLFGSPRIALFSHRADHGHLPAGLRAGQRGRRGKTGQRAFCVHRAAPIQQVAFPADGHFTRNRVDVPEQHDLARAIAQCANHIPHTVHLDGKA